MTANLDYFTQQNDSSQWKEGEKEPPKKQKQTKPQNFPWYRQRKKIYAHQKNPKDNTRSNISN